jgi:hypothetical protein
MKHLLKLLGIIALVAVIGFSMAACGGSGGGSGSGKSIRIIDLDDFYGSSYQLGLATSIDNLLSERIVAFAEGTIRSGTQTAPLLDYYTGDPWTGSGSYYVGVIIDNFFLAATRSKISFSSSVTTISVDDFEEYTFYDVEPVEPPDYY